MNLKTVKNKKQVRRFLKAGGKTVIVPVAGGNKGSKPVRVRPSEATRRGIKLVSEASEVRVMRLAGQYIVDSKQHPHGTVLVLRIIRSPECFLQQEADSSPKPK